MGLEDLKKKIASDAEAQVRAVNDEADARVSEIEGEVKAKTVEKVAELLHASERKAEAQAKKIVSAAKVEASSHISSEKNRLLEEVFSEAEKQVLALSDKEKKKLMQELVSDATHLGGTVTAYVDPKYTTLVPKTTGVTVKEKKLGDFGVLLSSKDGALEVDNTLSSVLSRAKDKIKSEAAKALFGGEA